MFLPPRTKSRNDKCLAYASEDGGRTWRVACVDWGHPDDPGTDPTVAYGPDGTAYFAGIVLGKGTSGRERFALFHSRDGGKTWKNVKKAGIIDRPFLVADGTRGRYRGRLYCAANLIGAADGPNGADGLSVATSTDGGQTLGRFRVIPLDPMYEPGGIGNPVVLQDGTLAALYEIRNRYYERGRLDRMLAVALSTDGGSTFQSGTPFGSYSIGRAPRSIPMLAVAPVSTAATVKRRARLHTVWCVEDEDGSRIQYAYSDDRGATWEGEDTLSENAGRKGRPYLAFLPCVTVNHKGIVAVSWYDTRALPSQAKGWDIRFRISLDGGITWQPSVRVNEKTSRFVKGSWASSSPAWPGDTAGLACTADGTFHLLWIDNRTGVRQVWTTAIRIG
jgi:Neuraminidase (sialidase)